MSIKTVELKRNGHPYAILSYETKAIKDCPVKTIVADYWLEESGNRCVFHRITKANTKSYYAIRCRPDGTFKEEVIGWDNDDKPIYNTFTEQFKKPSGLVKVLVSYKNLDEKPLLAITDGKVE